MNIAVDVSAILSGLAVAGIVFLIRESIRQGQRLAKVEGILQTHLNSHEEE